MPNSDRSSTPGRWHWFDAWTRQDGMIKSPRLGTGDGETVLEAWFNTSRCDMEISRENAYLIAEAPALLALARQLGTARGEVFEKVVDDLWALAQEIDAAGAVQAREAW